VDFNLLIQQLAIMSVPVLMAITIHEVAHGYMADRLGDHTARLAGRLTLNPLRHLDLIGTAVFFLTRVIGWAKPVPINPRNLKNPRRDLLWIAVAGPAANLALALASAVLFHGLQFFQPFILGGSPAAARLLLPLTMMVKASVFINTALCIFNLIPVPPLDGSRILAGLLPPGPAMLMARIEPYGFIILMVLIFSNAINLVIVPAISFLVQAMIGMGFM